MFDGFGTRLMLGAWMEEHHVVFDETAPDAVSRLGQSSWSMSCKTFDPSQPALGIHQVTTFDSKACERT